MSKNVAFTSNTAISCCCDTSPVVVLCVSDPSLLAPYACAEESETPFELHTIEGTLVSCIKNVSACGTACSYRYVVSYDENLLADPEVLLTGDDISGIFCKDCGTQWVEDLVGNEIAVAYDPETELLTFTSQHGCVTEFTVAGVGCIASGDTVALSFDEGGCITAEVILDPAADNIIQANENGLYIPQTVDYNLLPLTTLTYTLGDPTHVWSTVYAAAISNPGAGNLTLSTTGSIQFNAGVTNKLTLSSSGHLSPAADNTYDLGNTSNNFRVVYTRQVAAETGNLVLRGGTGRSVHFYSNNALVLLLDSATGALYPNVDNTYDLGTTSRIFNTVYTEVVSAVGINLAVFGPAAHGVDFYSDAIQRLNLNSSGHLVPVINDNYNIGSNASMFANVYAHRVRANTSNLELYAAAGGIDIYTTGALGLVINPDGQIKNIAANEATGGGTAAFGAANCPAVTVGAVDTWLKFKKSDGSQLYVPAWK